MCHTCYVSGKVRFLERFLEKDDVSWGSVRVKVLYEDATLLWKGAAIPLSQCESSGRRRCRRCLQITGRHHPE